MRRRFFTAMVLTLLFFSSKAQVKQDTLAWQDFINIVKKNHPVTQKAKLQLELAKARRTQALGGFDPKLSVNYDRKFFDGKEYYAFLTPEVKLPLWFGAELKGSFTDASGAYLNPESKIPKEGLSYAGISFSLGKGLLMDRRRANWKLASVFERSSENEQAAILNNLFLDAGESYITWENRYRIYKMYENVVELAKIRLKAVKRSYIGGDRPAIDTTEAASQLQQRELQLQQSNMEVISALYDLSTYLWLNTTDAVDPDKLNLVPQIAFTLPATTETGIENNPKLKSYNFKLQQLNIERRLKSESLRPEVNLQLGLLNSGTSALSNVNPNYWNNNNKIGLQFSFPLTLSMARGELAEAKIKIRETVLEQSVVRVELDNKVKQALATINNISNQLKILKQLYQANKQLLLGEETRFKLGESSLFLVNARESKLLEVYEKLIETETKLKKSELKLSWLKGGLAEVY